MKIDFDVKLLKELRYNYVELGEKISESENIMALDLYHTEVGHALSEIFGPLWESIDRVFAGIENFSGDKEVEGFLDGLDSGQTLSLIACILNIYEKEV